MRGSQVVFDWQYSYKLRLWKRAIKAEGVCLFFSQPFGFGRFDHHPITPKPGALGGFGRWDRR